MTELFIIIFQQYNHLRIPFTPIISHPSFSINFLQISKYIISRRLSETRHLPFHVADNFHEREFFQRQRKSRDFLARAVIRLPVIRGPNIFTVVASYEKQGKKRERERERAGRFRERKRGKFGDEGAMEGGWKDRRRGGNEDEIVWRISRQKPSKTRRCVNNCEKETLLLGGGGGGKRGN